MYDKKEFSIRDTSIHKGIAIMMILGIHLFVRTDTSLYAYKWEIAGLPVLNYIFYQLKIGVTIFCLLSGYGLNESYKRKTLKYEKKGTYNFIFLRSHLSKLWINFWVVFVVFAGIGLSLGWISIDETWNGKKGVIIDFFGLQDIVYDFWPTKTLNPTWWYMSTIIILYLLFFLIKKAMKYNIYFPVILGIVLQVIAPYSTYRQVKYGFIFYFASFALGIFFSEKQILNQIKTFQFQNKWFVVIITILTTAITFLFRCYNNFWGDLPFALSCMFLIQLLIVDAKNKVSVFLSAVITFIGKHSFNIFALHTFYITIYGNNVLYKLRNPLLMYVVLVLLSLFTSIILEKIKETSGITFLQNKSNDMERLLSKKEVVSFDKKQSMQIKGVAICLLLFHHLFYSEYRLSCGGIVTKFISLETLMSIGTYARVCVWMFVFVSAYGLTKSYLSFEKPIMLYDRLSFYKRHYISLMKPYWFIWIVVFGVSFIFSIKPALFLQNNIIYIILNFLGVSDFFGMPTMCNPWWYMCLAQIILLFIPFLSEMIEKWGAVSLLLLFVLTQFINMEGIYSNSGGAYINYLFMMIFGVLFARYSIMEKLSVFYFTLPEFFMLVILVGTGMYFNRYLSDIDTWNISKMFLSFSALGICFLIYRFMPNIWGGFFTKILCFLGKYSGNMFLIHIFLFDQEYSPQLVYWSHNVILSWLTCVILSLGISIIIEFMKKFLKRQLIWKGRFSKCK